MTINEFLSKKLSSSGKNTLSLLQEKKVFVNGVPAKQKQFITTRDLIEWEGKVLQEPQHYFYLAYYKPRGIECTMNPEIPKNLSEAIPEYTGFFPIGRLDKDSEGLLLLTNDGQLYKQIAPTEALKEKEYLVTVDQPLTPYAVQSLSEGMSIMGKQTRPAMVTPLAVDTFSIVLTQGLNRQIRRMCYKLGYTVLTLKRIRIMALLLGELSPGEYRQITKEEIFS